MPREENVFTVQGIVKEINRGGKFVVEVEDHPELKVICTLSGKIRMNGIKILRGDRVDVDISTSDVKKGRIIWRYK